MKKKKDKIELGSSPTQSTLADILQAKGFSLLTPSKTVQEPKTPPAPSNSESEKSLVFSFATCEQVVLRYEKKGRGGKTVTVILGLGFSEAILSQIAQQIKASLGCGGGVEGDKVVLHGEQMIRVQAWLQKQGVKKVILGQRP